MVAITARWHHSPPTMWHAFVFLLILLVRLLRAACQSRDELVLENLALRQQVTALKLGKHKPRLHDADRAFWVALRRSTSNWANRLVIVTPVSCQNPSGASVWHSAPLKCTDYAASCQT